MVSLGRQSWHHPMARRPSAAISCWKITRVSCCAERISGTRRCSPRPATAVGSTPTQFAALWKAVELRKVTQNLLGRLTAMDPATIQGVVRRLMERGLLDRSEDPMDRRTAVLAPTEAGIALIGQGVACAQRSHRAVLSPLTADEGRQLLSLLRKIGDPNGQ